ncbi:hypothetical protein OC861_006656, partial [Tilletia horrida]
MSAATRDSKLLKKGKGKARAHGEFEGKELFVKRLPLIMRLRAETGASEKGKTPKQPPSKAPASAAAPTAPRTPVEVVEIASSSLDVADLYDWRDPYTSLHHMADKTEFRSPLERNDDRWAEEKRRDQGKRKAEERRADEKRGAAADRQMEKRRRFVRELREAEKMKRTRNWR